MKALRAAAREGNQRHLLDLVMEKPGQRAMVLGVKLQGDDLTSIPDMQVWNAARDLNKRLRPLGWEVSAKPNQGYHLRRVVE